MVIMKTLVTLTYLDSTKIALHVNQNMLTKQYDSIINASYGFPINDCENKMSFDTVQSLAKQTILNVVKQYGTDIAIYLLTKTSGHALEHMHHMYMRILMNECMHTFQYKMHS